MTGWISSRIPTDLSTVDGVESRSRRVLWALGSGACALILMGKWLLISRINVNWDEFYFLSHVHALTRGELQLVFQTAYTHLFAWLPRINGFEMPQILAARRVMILLLVATAVLLWALARRWAGARSAVIAPLCYLAMSPVVLHGGSFRSDSLLAPLLLLALLLLSHQPATRRAAISAGAVAGLAAAVTIKVALFAPLFVALALINQSGSFQGSGYRAKSAGLQLAIIGMAALATAVAILLLHRYSLTLSPVEGTGDFAVRAIRKTLLEAPLFPRWRFFRATLDVDWWIWILIGAGAVVALARRQFVAAIGVLALLPIVFYRNAFPYFYTVMLAPACVLGAVAADEVERLLVRRLGAARAYRVAVAVPVLIAAHAATGLFGLRNDDQAQQRAVIAAVHEVFPRPVSYVDPSGMIASFPKANFFMSTWGVEAYLARGIPFMPEALAVHRPPLMLANRPVLAPGTLPFMRLLKEDQTLLVSSYVPYWGPIYVAGAQATVPPTGEVQARVPFPGRYRVHSAKSILVDGDLRQNGDIVECGAESLLSLAQSGDAAAPIKAQLIWADAREPPSYPAPLVSLYSGF